MKTEVKHCGEWKQIYIVLFVLISMAIVLQPSRKGALESIGMVTDYALSTQHDDQHITAPSPSPSSSDQQESSSSSAQVPSPGCNYGKGRWVADSRRPVYSAFRCKLSNTWNCRLTPRTDFSFEGYRWQPQDCQIPEFERSTFLKRMQNKTIAFIGDSLGRQQFESMMCMAYGGEVKDVTSEYGLVKPTGRPGGISPQGWVYWFTKTNTTILFHWSVTLCAQVPLFNKTDPAASNVALHLDRPPRFLTRNLHRFDVLVLNTGHHWNTAKLKKNRWVIHVNGKPIEKKSLLQYMRNAKNFTVHSIVKWVDSQLGLYPQIQLKAFFRTISPKHFQNGDWNTGGTCNNTTPFTRGSEVMRDESRDKVVKSAVRGTKVKILDVTAISQLRDEAHMAGYTLGPDKGISDCLHWCLPGVPDTWNELLIAQI